MQSEIQIVLTLVLVYKHTFTASKLSGETFTGQKVIDTIEIGVWAYSSALFFTPGSRQTSFVKFTNQKQIRSKKNMEKNF